MITTDQYSITTTATKVADPNGAHATAYLHIVGNAALYVGGPQVTTTTGLILRKDHGVFTVNLGPQDALYAIGGEQAETLTVMLIK